MRYKACRESFRRYLLPALCTQILRIAQDDTIV